MQANFMDGFPFGLIGKNDEVAFGCTTIMTDNVDLYRENITDNATYLVDGQQRPLVKHPETIKVKGSQDFIF
jgi:penicillin amidase